MAATLSQTEATTGTGTDSGVGARVPPLAVLWVGLSLSIGWGIRGNFGHEFGAMLPGVLATVAAVLLSGREDWHRQVVYFALFGALGWAVGGSISYMQVIAYTHSGHSLSVIYGFACLFVIGFLWAAIGGAGSALPAFVSPERLKELFPPLAAICAVWVVQEMVVSIWFQAPADFRQNSVLYWHDTDWLNVLTAMLALLGLALARRRVDWASSLLLHAAVGWWLAFLVLVELLGLRMTPPRGDNWAGCVGILGGFWVYCQRHQLAGLTFCSLLCGLIGGVGFAGATLLKLIGVSTGAETNWHSVLEQVYGFINGIGLAVALFWAARAAPRLNHETVARSWTEPWALGFVLLGVTFANLRQLPEQWVKAQAMPQVLWGLSVATWFNFGYLALAFAFVVLVRAHRRNALPFLPGAWLGRAQLLYLGFLWWIVLGNFARALVAFAPQRLVTEGVIFLNAVLCTVGVALAQRPPGIRLLVTAPHPQLLRRTALIGLAAFTLSTAADWALVRAIYGDRFAGYAGKHIRFGPDATATKEKPAANAPHP